jgi:hypothetical protein
LEHPLKSHQTIHSFRHFLARKVAVLLPSGLGLVGPIGLRRPGQDTQHGQQQPWNQRVADPDATRFAWEIPQAMEALMYVLMVF